MMSALSVEAVGVYGPGLQGWLEAEAVLRGERAYQCAELEKYRPQRLPANERRRATEATRVAFGACEDAMRDGGAVIDDCGAVFASSGGDYGISHQICTALMGSNKAVSPTQFHNSVHNAPAGYWSIATGSTLPSSSLSAYDCSAAVGLVEASVLATVEGFPVLLCVSDCATCEPFQRVRPVTRSFGCALLLSPMKSSRTLATLSLEVLEKTGVSQCLNSHLEGLRTDNPAARMLPVLEVLARKDSQRLTLDMPGAQSLVVNLEFEG